MPGSSLSADFLEGYAPGLEVGPDLPVHLFAAVEVGQVEPRPLALPVLVEEDGGGEVEVEPPGLALPGPDPDRHQEGPCLDLGDPPVQGCGAGLHPHPDLFSLEGDLALRGEGGALVIQKITAAAPPINKTAAINRMIFGVLCARS